MKFQYVSFLDNVVFPPLNELCIQGLSRYASSPINIYGSNSPSMHACPILIAFKTTQLRRFFFPTKLTIPKHTTWSNNSLYKC